MWVFTVVPSTFTCKVAVKGEVTSLLRNQYVSAAVPTGMTTTWEMLAVWPDDEV